MSVTDEQGLVIKSGLEAMPEAARVAFLDYVDQGPRREIAELHRRYEEAKNLGLQERDDVGLIVIPTTRKQTLYKWSTDYRWKELAPMVWAQRGRAQRSEAVSIVDHASSLAAETLIEQLGAQQAVVLRKGGRDGDDVIEFVADNAARTKAASTLLNLAGIVPARVSISERLSSAADGSGEVRTRTIDIEGASSEELMRDLHERLIHPSAVGG